VQVIMNHLIPLLLLSPGATAGHAERKVLLGGILWAMERGTK
jgi:hypothetical protein